MKIRTQAVADMLNKIANEIAAKGDTTDEQEIYNTSISILIKMLMEAGGITIREAFDMVLGEGAYEKMTGDLYDKLRAKADMKAAESKSREEGLVDMVDAS